MTTTVGLLTPSAGLFPAKGTYPMPANTLILKGTIVQVNAANRGIPGADAQAFPAVGVASQTYDNRTGAISGGGNDDLDCEVEAGVFGFAAETGHEPDVGATVFVSANDEISADSDTGARGIAGRCVEIRDSLYWIYMGPHVGPAIVEAATVAADLDTAEADIDALEGEVDGLQTDEAMGRIDVPLTSFAVVSTGLPLATAFNDGVADGLQWSEGLLYRFNPASTAAIGASVPLPAELDGTEAVTIRILASRVGAGDAATACFTVAAYFAVDGAAPAADDDCGGDTGLVAAATTLLDTVTCTIAAADVPDAGPALLSFSIVPKAGSLPADDLLIHAVTVEFAKSLTA